ncbi:MAG: hypothetical protein [Microvirus sp.]|nr:MAG: hypothetical protein [Microvirus sp.]
MDVRNAIRQLVEKLDRQRKAVRDTEEHIAALEKIQAGEVAPRK